jgi:nucleolar protein 14
MKLKKGNKRGRSEAIYAKKSKVIEKKQNPFELHVNREKFNILNRRRNHSLGQPLVSRQKAFERRKETLGVEYSVRNKANVFEDKRRGGGGGFHKQPKESIYNLNDSEILTHRGQTLGEIEQFDDAVPDEDDDNSDEETRLDGKRD